MDINEAFRLAAKYYQEGNLQQAEYIYREILKFQPDVAEGHYFLGIILQDKGQIDEAVTCYQKTLQFNPNFIDAYYNLGTIFQQRWQLDQSIIAFQKVLQLNPFDAEAYTNLGHSLQWKGLLDEAITCYQKSLEVNPNLSGTYYNLAMVFQDKGHYDQAMDCYQKTLQLNPDHPGAHWSIAVLHLLSGNLKEGWKGYEWRWRMGEHNKRNFRNFAQPLWNGSDIAGLTILLHDEQGFGDSIQCIRYSPLVKQRGAKVIVECRKELESLFQKVEGISQVFPRGEELPAFDVYCPLLSLPLMFQTILQNIPAKVPYITVDAQLVHKWQDKIKHDISKIKIGLVWTGSKAHLKDRYRSCSLELFAPLAQLENISFYSLQKEKDAEHAETSTEDIKLYDYTKEMHDFLDTAACIENLDLIITVDTAVAHLAGALGKPVWTLLPFSPDWRWLLNREDSPWYPTMRLFRQPSRGDWESVIAKVKDELLKLLNTI